MLTASPSVAPLASGTRRALTAVLTFMAGRLDVRASTSEVAQSVGHALAVTPSGSFAEQAFEAGRRIGLATSVVRRPLAEVLADADPGFPWLAIRHVASGAVEVLAVVDRAAAGARVVMVGEEDRPATWSRASMRQWLGVGDDGTAVEWLVGEAIASLTALRTEEGAPRLEPRQRLRALLTNERRTLWIAFIYSVVIGLLTLVAPIAVQSLVNTIAFTSNRQPLLVLTLFVLVALGFSTVMNAGRAFVVEIIQRSIFARVATDVTWRLVRVRADAFDRYHGPELVNRFFDTVTVQKSAALLLIDGLNIAMQTIIGMLLLAVYHPWLLAFDIILIVAMIGIVFGLGRGAIPTAIKESKAKYALEAWLEQIAASLVTFKSGGGTQLAFSRSYALLETYLHYRTEHFRILIRQIVGSFALQAAASSALLGIGGWLVINRQLTLGQLVASELIVTLMLSAFTKFGKQLEVFYDLSAAIDKLGDLIDLPVERSGGTALLPTTVPASVQLRDAELRYDGAVQPALRVGSLDIAAGDRVGITGSHGSGKSTLADVLFGLRALTTGSLLIDGFDSRELSLDDWRAHAVLVRHVELFPGTIADNVRAGVDIDDERLLAALRTVGLLDELRALPAGLATELQPHGRPLSHRQACRVMLARALVRAPRLLVIDGLLDQLDQGDEHKDLMHTLFADDAPWTLICITERADLLARCERILRAHQGRVVDATSMGAGE